MAGGPVSPHRVDAGWCDEPRPQKGVCAPANISQKKGRSTSSRPRQITAPSAAGTAGTGDGLQDADPASPRMPTNTPQRRVTIWARSRWATQIAYRLKRQTGLKFHTVLPQSRGAIVSHDDGWPHSEPCRLFCRFLLGIESEWSRRRDNCIGSLQLAVFNMAQFREPGVTACSRIRS